jgi:hypothetical protein
MGNLHSSPIPHYRKLPAPGDLFVFQPSNSTKIHLWIGMGFLCNVQAKTTHQGFFFIIHNKNTEIWKIRIK